MKLIGEVTGTEHRGDGAKITIGNIRKKDAPCWQEYNPEIVMYGSMAMAKTYHLGRSVEITVKGKRTSLHKPYAASSSFPEPRRRPSRASLASEARFARTGGFRCCATSGLLRLRR